MCRGQQPHAPYCAGGILLSGSPETVPFLSRLRLEGTANRLSIPNRLTGSCETAGYPVTGGRTQ